MQGLKQMREKRGLTQAVVAHSVGVKKSTVSMWETVDTRPRKETLDKLCKFFGCKIDDLM